MNRIKKYLLLTLAVIRTAAGSALGIKAAVGVTAWDALTIAIADLIQFKIGTVGMILNTTCFIGQLLLLGKNFKKQQYFQIVVTFLVGFVVNFMLYEVFTFELPAYWLRMVMIIFSYIIMAFFAAIVMNLNLITFPLEGLVIAVTKYVKIDFAKLRQLVDVFSIVFCILIAVVFSDNLVVREGTVIGMLVFGPLLGRFMTLQWPVLEKYGLVG